MKLKLWLSCIFAFANLPLLATPYEVWEIKAERIEVDCIPAVVDLNDYRLEPYESEEGDDTKSPSGTIEFYIKKNKIIDSIDIKEKLDELYHQYKNDDLVEPFLASGAEYILMDKSSRQFYYCFVEWDIRVRRGIPRIALAPMSQIDENTFILMNMTVTASSVPFVDSLVKMIESRPIAK